jgi:hypothetical protein
MSISKVTRGTPLRTALRAETWNAFVDAANAHKTTAERAGDGRRLLDEMPTLTVLVRNDTGAAVGRGAVLGISGGPVVTPAANQTEFLTRSGWIGDTPVTADHGRFVITAEPIPDNGIGLAYVAGVVSCEVNISHTFLMRADIDAGVSTHLVAKPNGSAQILWIEAGTGTNWAVVRIGPSMDCVAIGKTAAEVTAGSTGNVSIWQNGADTGYQVSGVKLDWMHGSEKISSGKQVQITWFASERVWRFTGAECET